MAATYAAPTAATRPPRWRFDVQLTSPTVLAGFLKLKHWSLQDLANAVGCSKATIGFLHSTGSSARNTCNPTLARKIEEALGCPPGVLFMARVTTPNGVGRTPSATRGRLR